MTSSPLARSAALLGASLSLLLACSSPESALHAPGDPSAAGRSGSSGSGPLAGSAGATSAGAAGQAAGEAGAAGSAGKAAGGAGSAGAGQAGAGTGGISGGAAGGTLLSPAAGSGSGGAPAWPACGLSKPGGESVPLAGLSTPASERLGSVTPDERVLAWQVVDEAGAASVFVAERASAAEPFGPPTAVPAPEGGVAAGRVALSPDGLRLVLVRADHKAMTELLRPSLGEPFAAPSAKAFAQINALADDGSDGLGSPVIGADDRTLYFTYGDPAKGGAIRRATRSEATDPWGKVTPLHGDGVNGLGAQAMEPTGLSADGHTLFLWSPSKERSYAAPASAAFATPVDLGPLRYVSPSADCSRLYHSTGSSTATLDLAVTAP